MEASFFQGKNSRRNDTFFSENLSCSHAHRFIHSFTRLILPAERVEAAAGAAQAGDDEGQQQHHGQDHAGDQEPGRELEKKR